MKRLLLLAVVGCASVPANDPPPTLLVVDNQHLRDAVVYVLPCGSLACPVKLGEAPGAHTVRLQVRAWQTHADGRVYLAFALRPDRRMASVPPVGVPHDSHVALTIASTLGQAFAYAEVDR